MLRKKEAYTVITPIPRFIPRQLALDILHSHSEVITLNPLVLDHQPISAPRTAAADEYYSTWYEITERVQIVPGAGRIGSSKITFNGCFHDMPWGLQTHIYAPFSIDLRNKYRIAGNQPGIEQPEPREIGLEGLGAPADGLYLREDIEIRCNISLVGFVKAQLKAASKEMVQRIIRKAELLDAGILQAMMSPDGRLQTINPNDRSRTRPHGHGHSHSVPSLAGSPLNRYQSPSISSRPGTASPNEKEGNPYNQLHYQTDSRPESHSPRPIPPAKDDCYQHVVELPGDFQYRQSPNSLQAGHLSGSHSYSRQGHSRSASCQSRQTDQKSIQRGIRSNSNGGSGRTVGDKPELGLQSAITELPINGR